MVNESPWPLLSSLSSMTLVIGIEKWFFNSESSLFITSMILTTWMAFSWWMDVSCEGAFQGVHTHVVENNMSWGMMLFIVSECFFFLSFFWAFFHLSLSPDTYIGASWPPIGINNLSPFSVPLLNTAVLVCSGITLTWAHMALKKKNMKIFMYNTLATILMGVYFSLLQGMEYFEVSFMMSDSCYGSTFFIATGFHGLHVLIGTLFIIVSATRGVKGQFSQNHHFGFEAAAWYWHFVDIVWLMLYVLIYWWGGM